MENLLAQPSRHYETDFVLAQLGHSVGLAAFWRFPYLCHENGGGSFIVSYVFLLFAMGFPLIFMEMALGQNLHFSGWKQIHPRMWGLNLATCLISFMLLLYYNAVIAWSIFYLGNSFLCPLPWSQCPVGANGTSEVLECVRTRPSIYFWFRETLMVTGSIEEGGGLVFSLTVCLLVVWVSILFIWLQGLQAKGKVLYLSVLGPYVVLMYFLIQSCLLEGSIFGMLHFIQIKKSLITSTKVWRQAGAQMFISTGLGIGNIIFLYSCATKNNCAQDAFMLTFTHMASCLLTTQVIFSMLGFQAAILTRKCVLRNSWKLLDLIARGVLPLEATPPKDLNKKAVQSYAMWLEQLNSDLRKKVLEHVAECNMEDELRRVRVSKQGPGLVFVAFTEAVTSFPGSSFWAVLFFLLLISQGLNVSVSQLQGTLTLLQDIFPSLSNFSLTISVTYCCLGFLCSLLFTQRSGLYFLKLFDEILATLPLIIMIFFETVGVAWIYGAKRFLDEVWAMLEFKIKLMHEYVLRYYTLLGVMILIIISLLDFIMEQPTYQAWDSSTSKQRVISFPPWSMALGFSLVSLTILPIPVGLLIYPKKAIVLPVSQDALSCDQSVVLAQNAISCDQSRAQTLSYDYPGTLTQDSVFYDYPSTPTQDSLSYDLPGRLTQDSLSYDLPGGLTQDSLSYDLPGGLTQDSHSFDLPNVWIRK